MSESACRLGAALLQSAPSLADTLQGGIADAFASFDGEALRSLGEAHRAWRRWTEALDEIDEELLRAFAAAHTTTPEQARFLAEADPSVDDAPAILALFDEVLDAGRAEAAVRVGHGPGRAARPEDDRGEGGGRGGEDPYAEVRGRRFPISEIAPARWLLLRQGEADGALRLDIDVPVARLQARFADSGDAVVAQVAGVVAPVLPEALAAVLDEQGRLAVVRSAAAQYLALLRGRPTRADRVLAIYVGRARDPIGVALLNKDGGLLEHAVLHHGPDWGQRLERFVREQQPDQAVLPSDGPAPRLLQDVARRLPPRLPTTRVRRAALDVARRSLTGVDAELPPVVQAAIALGRRALDPAGEWGRLDPAAIHLVDHQGLVPEDRVREALCEARLTRSAGGPPRAARAGAAAGPDGGAPASPVAPGPSAAGASRRRVVVEPPRARARGGRPSIQRRKVEVVGEDVEVKSLADLRTGMLVRGVVTNTSKFGAFVSLGLPEEGLIHVSELADHYVGDPGEIVAVGQEITTRVIQVDPARKRVSLSLKEAEGDAAAEPGARSGPGPSLGPPPPRRNRVALDDDGTGGPPRDRDGPPGGVPSVLRTGVPQSRSQALAELNRLFKDK